MQTILSERLVSLPFVCAVHAQQGDAASDVMVEEVCHVLHKCNEDYKTQYCVCTDLVPVYHLGSSQMFR